MTIENKIKQLEAEVSAIDWTADQVKADGYRVKWATLEASILERKKVLNEINTKIGKLKEVAEILEEQ